MRVAFAFTLLAAACFNLIVKACPGQCQPSETILQLPHEDNWCFNSLDDLINPYPSNHPWFGCWTGFNHPHFYVFTPMEDITIEVHIDSDLYSTNPFVGSSNQVVYYALFNGCPSLGGVVLSYPCNCALGCWTFGGNFINWSCWWDSNGALYETGAGVSHCDTGQPPWNFPTHSYSISFDLAAGGEYWLLVGAPASPNNNNGANYTYGCIDVLITGPAFLSFPEESETTPAQQEEVPVIKYPRKVVHPVHGFCIEYKKGRYINTLFQQLN